MRWPLGWLPPDWRDSVDGDLAEQGRRVRPLFRRPWLAMESCEIVLAFGRDRLRERWRGRSTCRGVAHRRRPALGRWPWSTPQLHNSTTPN